MSNHPRLPEQDDLQQYSRDYHGDPDNHDVHRDNPVDMNKSADSNWSNAHWNDDDARYDSEIYHKDDNHIGHYDRHSERGFNIAASSVTKESEYYDSFPDQDTSANHEEFSAANQGIDHSFQVYQEDLRDLAHAGNKNGMRKLGIGLAAAIVLPLLAVGFIRSSQPELSAYEIVQRDSYQVAQEPRAIFNLADLNEKVGCAATGTCKQTIAPKIDIKPAAQTRLLEIPAVVVTNETVDDVIIPTTTQYITQEKPLTTDVVSTQMVVQKQWSIIRETPDIDGEIITSLAKGKTVEVLGSFGKWMEIRANNAAGTRGYMHWSTLGYSVE